MRIGRRLNPTIFLAALLMAGSLAAGEPGLMIQVASRAFIVSVSPVDRDSENAENAMLYRRAAEGAEWTADGPCRKTVQDGKILFTRETAVEADGVYQFTSRPVVGGQVAEPPGQAASPQAVVVVDTLPPLAEITEPPEGAEIAPGGNLRIAWTASDENLGPDAAALSYTTDGGKSWIPIDAKLPARGEIAWTAPERLSGPAVIRLTVSDLAGNLGRDARRLELAAARTPEPAAPPEKALAAGEREREEAPPAPPGRDTGRSWLYYLMAVNLMRQDQPAEALRYYWLSVREDPDFVEAWADIGLAYISLGAYGTARETLALARDRAPDRSDLMHLTGEAHHAEGMALLAAARSPEERLAAKELVDQAAAWYGRALKQAEKDWRLAEQAASFYRLGEICYYVNLDRDGARAYWEKILRLHAPAPNLDLVLWTPEAGREKARIRLQHDTYRRDALTVWQNWARGYLAQLDIRERAGLADFPPLRPPAAARPQPLPYGGNDFGPGRDDGRSLFSLPAQLGSPPGIPAASGTTPAVAGRPADAYAFYARKSPAGAGMRAEKPSRRLDSTGSVFSGGPDAPAPANPDPYAFPGRSRPPAWNGRGPYGEAPGGEP